MILMFSMADDEHTNVQRVPLRLWRLCRRTDLRLADNPWTRGRRPVMTRCLVLAPNEERARQIAQDEAGAEVGGSLGRGADLWENEYYTTCEGISLELPRLVDRHLAPPERIRRGAEAEEEVLEFVSTSTPITTSVSNNLLTHCASHELSPRRLTGRPALWLELRVSMRSHVRD